MADKDKFGNYVNDKGVTIKINTDKICIKRRYGTLLCNSAYYC